MILTVIGARPQFVKAAVVSRALKARGIEEAVIHTGQHYDSTMSDVFWEELGLSPWLSNLMVGSGNHGTQTAKIIEGIESILLKTSEINGLIVYGDTNSTLGAALAAVKLHIPVIHIEAGLRSFNRKMPEEVNRVMTDHISALLFCSSETGVEWLRREGIEKGVFNVGDVMADAHRYYSTQSEGALAQAELGVNISQPFVIATIHRPSNTDDTRSLEEIIRGLETDGRTVIWPLHPRLKSHMQGRELPPNIKLTRPLSYFEMLDALSLCELIYTDSGGLQKEAYWSRKPCVTMRLETEWVETVESGWNILSGPSAVEMNQARERLEQRPEWIPLYGDGFAADRIAECIESFLEER